MNKRIKKGFTLVELLVVIGIISILASAGAYAFVGSNKKARDTRRAYELQQIQTALVSYAISNDDKYPASLEDLNITLPKDPLTGGSYFYCTNGTASSRGNTYHLGASMEVSQNHFLESDADIVSDGCITGSFNGESANCIGTGSCQGANCEGCYDLDRIYSGEKPPGGGADDGGNGGGEGSTPDIQQPTAPASFSVTTPASYQANLSWNPSVDNSGIAEYRIHTIGYLMDRSSSPWRWRDMERIEKTSDISFQVMELYPLHQYTFFVEAVDPSGNVSSSSQPVTVIMDTHCGDASCDDGEYCFLCQKDCGNCPQPLDFYRNDPYFKQFFPNP